MIVESLRRGNLLQVYMHTQIYMLQIPGNYPVFVLKNQKIWVVWQCLQVYLIRYTSETRLKL